MTVVKSFANNGGRAAVQQVVRKQQFDVSETIAVLLVLLFTSKNLSVSTKKRKKAADFLKILDIDAYRNAGVTYTYLRMAEILANVVVKHDITQYARIKVKALEYEEFAENFRYLFEDIESGEPLVVEAESISSELSNEDVAYIEAYVSQRLRFRSIWNSSSHLREIADAIDSGTYADFDSFLSESEEVLSGLLYNLRDSKQSDKAALNDFIVGDSSFDDAVRRTVELRQRPSNKIKTGVRLLNTMLNGGYEGGRVYTYFAVSGGGKSVLLVNSALWATDPLFNSNYVTKDPTKEPAVIYWTGENDVYETIERLISQKLNCTIEVRDLTGDELVDLFNEAFKDASCRFVFKYRKSRSFTVEDIEATIEELDASGYEVVMVVLDYIKRVKSIDFIKDRHIELGNIVDDLSSRIAKAYNIPVVTANQMNRSAYSILEEELKKNNLDGIKKLNESNSGESINIIENSDVVIFYNPLDLTEIEKAFGSFRRAKMRGRLPTAARQTNLFYQPFDTDDDVINGMRFVHDEHLEEHQIKGSMDVSELVGTDYNPTENNRRASSAQKAMSGGSAVPQPARPQLGSRDSAYKEATSEASDDTIFDD